MISKATLRQRTAGFTLIEMIVVIVILSVLASIAAPGWLAFANRQRAIAARDQVLQELRFTQAQAKRTREDQTLVLDPTADPPTITSPGSSAQPLGDGRTGLIQLQSSVTEIHFDKDGNLVDEEGNPPADNLFPIKIVVTAPPTTGAKRCVVVETLLGATRTAGDSECN
jgi:prepilin-type N-terminal cleavage/methylation domain-containing protein